MTECVNVYAEIKVNQEKREARGVRFLKAASTAKQEAVQKAKCVLFSSIKRSASVILFKKL